MKLKYIFDTPPANVDKALKEWLDKNVTNYRGFKITRELTLPNGKLKVEYDLTQ